MNKYNKNRKSTQKLLFVFISIILFTNCFHQDIYQKAISSLSNLDYTISIQNGTLENNVLSLFPARINREAYSYPVIIHNPNSDQFAIKDIYIEEKDSPFFIEDSKRGSSVPGKGTLNFEIKFGPSTVGDYTATLVLKTDWSPAKRFTVNGTAVESAIYITPEGDDETGDGSPVLPFYSIKKAVENAVYGEEIHVAEGEYYYTEEQIINVGGIKILGSYSNDGKWIRDEEKRNSIIKNKIVSNNNSTIVFQGSDVNYDNEINGFTIHASDQLVDTTAVVLISGGTPVVAGNTLIGGSNANTTFGIVIVDGASPLIGFNLIYGTNIDSYAKTWTNGVHINQNSGITYILSNDIFGGVCIEESVGIYFNNSGSASVDIHGNVIFSGISGNSNTVSVYLEGNGSADNSYIVQNTLITGDANGARNGLINNNVNSYLINNLFTGKKDSTNQIIAIYEEGTIQTINVADSNNFDFTTGVVDTIYIDTIPNTYTDAVSFNTSGFAFNNTDIPPVFDSYDEFNIQPTTDLAIKTGGLDLVQNSTITSTYGYMPEWLILFDGVYKDKTGNPRTGNSTDGYTIGAIELD
jgi:hypothetical protein